MQPRSPWLENHTPNPRASLRLFCFHSAGGSSVAYRLWHQRLPTSVEVRPVSLPGHGSRHFETPYRQMGPLIGALADALGPQLESPFALFGHSMGGLVAFELARELRRRGARAPEHLYVAGRLAPEAPPTRPLVHDLPDATMIDVMQRRYRAIPRAVLDEPEFLALLLPTLRADMSVIETYTYQAEAPLDVPLTIFGGVDDEGVPLAGLEAWRAHTTKSVAIHAVAGGHFFLSTNEKAFLPLLASALAPRQRAEHEDAVGLDAPR